MLEFSAQARSMLPCAVTLPVRLVGFAGGVVQWIFEAAELPCSLNETTR
jgi:hypothetical protein